MKRWLELIGALLPIMMVGFAISERVGVWDHWRGLDQVELVARRFDLSYAPEASTPVRIGDPAWAPLVKLIDKYSHADLNHKNNPRVIARFPAIADWKMIDASNNLIEWTSPGTPLAIMYRDWPGQEIPRQDYRIIGTIGDLHSWITQSRADFHSTVVDIILTLTSGVLGIIVWRLGKRRKGV